MGDLVHTLSKPIQAHGETVSELRFREPTGADIVNVGNPVIFDMASDPPKVTHDDRKMAAMMARLANVPPSSIGLMAPQDWVACAWLLTLFRADGGSDLVSACIRLSLIYKGGGAPLPWLLDLPPAVLGELFRRTNDVLDELEEDDPD